MKSKNQPTRILVLSQAQACALARLFDGLLLQVNCRSDDLAEVAERLSDALWTARWLKENVYLELPAEETISLLEAVLATVNEHHWSDEDCRALQGVLQQLSAAPSMPAVVDSDVKTPSVATVP